MYISEIASDKDGKLKMVSTRPVEDEGVAGMWFTCGGTKTPWNTHLGEGRPRAWARQPGLPHHPPLPPGFLSQNNTVLLEWCQPIDPANDM
jgi:hypothetical protein